MSSVVGKMYLQSLIQRRILMLEAELAIYRRANDLTAAHAVAGAVVELQQMAKYLKLKVHAEVPVGDVADPRYPYSTLAEEFAKRGQA